MKSLRSHFSVIFPLIVLLMSIQFTINLEKIVKDYEKNLVQDYSIIAVCTKIMSFQDFSSFESSLSSATLMSTKKVLQKLKGDISSKNLSLLQVSLPKFYSLKLKYFPSNHELKKIKQKLSKIPSVSKVEIFSKTHNKIYNLFIIAKYTFYIFTFLIFIISFLLMLKQMRIWVYEHKERMEIMTLFGAPFWMKSAMLYRLAIFDCIVAFIIVVAIFYLVPYLDFLKSIAEQIDIFIPQIKLLSEGLILFLISLLFAFISVSMVMIQIKKG